jgi:ribonuclease P protein component
MNSGTPDRLRFGSRSRIKTGRDFSRVKARGHRLVLGSLIANWANLPPGSISRLGVVTSKKIGGAVIRNRVRRGLRENFRQHQYQFSGPVDLVLIGRPSIHGKDFKEIQKDFLTILVKAGLLRKTEKTKI